MEPFSLSFANEILLPGETRHGATFHGDYIEHTLGLFMCISTMAAAALGNTISDVIGIGSAFYVEKLAEMSGVKPPKMSPIQLEMKASRRAANLHSSVEMATSSLAEYVNGIIYGHEIFSHLTIPSRIALVF
uniref:Uncharacterized protein n=1 Tax=Anopheles melas TaxID=34690 RepID=A0A182U5Q9_9DIPT